jgi:hypothetical protein
MVVLSGSCAGIMEPISYVQSDSISRSGALTYNDEYVVYTWETSWSVELSIRLS